MLSFANRCGRALALTGGRGQLVVMMCLMLAMAVTAAPQAALAAGKFAAITVDARNGKILFAENADAPRYPASLTKMMTLYVLFQDLKSGKIKLNSPIRMSARAASMAPSKLGVKAGKTITVETAIRALVVKSANDVAAAVAENLGGTEAAFAKRMTRTARAIGMSKTTFANASGLPNPNQITTARDMATLGLRLMRDFPQYYPYFRTQSFVHGGRTIRGHNRLLGRFEGTDGIKTGYINASGFNLVTSARRGDQRLVGVVMGGKTGNSRNAYMIKMLDKHFPKATRGKTIAALAGSSKGAVNPVGDTMTATATKKKRKSLFGSGNKEEAEPTPEVAEAPVATPVEEGDTGQDEDGAATAGLAPSQKDGDSPGPTTIPEVLESSMGGAQLPAKLPFDVKVEEPQPAEADLATAAPEAGAWTIQVGAFATKNDAQARLRQLQKDLPQLFEGKTAVTATVEKDKAITYRARFTGYDDEGAAKAACSQLLKRKTDCYVLAPVS